ncbi:MAG: hypothetical protein QW303_07635 [Nitrososphaerota archaeon]
MTISVNYNSILTEDFGSYGTYAIDPREIKGPPAFSGGKVFGTKELVSTDASTCNCNCATSIDSIDIIKLDISEIKIKLSQLIDQLQNLQNVSQNQPSADTSASAGGLGASPPPPPPTTPPMTQTPPSSLGGSYQPTQP